MKRKEAVISKKLRIDYSQLPTLSKKGPDQTISTPSSRYCTAWSTTSSDASARSSRQGEAPASRRAKSWTLAISVNVSLPKRARLLSLRRGATERLFPTLPTALNSTVRERLIMIRSSPLLHLSESLQASSRSTKPIDCTAAPTRDVKRRGSAGSRRATRESVGWDGSRLPRHPLTTPSGSSRVRCVAPPAPSISRSGCLLPLRCEPDRASRASERPLRASFICGMGRGGVSDSLRRPIGVRRRGAHRRWKEVTERASSLRPSGTAGRHGPERSVRCWRAPADR